ARSSGRGTSFPPVGGRVMSVTVRLPSQLRTLVGGAGEVPVEAGAVREAILAVDVAYPGIAFRVLDDRGALRRFVNVFVADEDVRFFEELHTALQAGAAVSRVPAFAGA